MGYFFERVSRAFTFIWASIKMAFRDKDLIVPSLVAIFANLAYVGAILGVLYATNSLWLVGVEKSDVDAIRNARQAASRTPQEALDEKVESMREEALAEEQAQKDAVARGENPEAVTAAPQAEPRDASDVERRGNESKTRKYVQYAFDAAAVFGALFINYFFTAMTISLVHAHLMGKDARVGEALGVVTRRIGGIFLLAVVATLVEIAASLARDKKGRETFVSAAIKRLWTVASFLILPAIVIENFSLWRALKRAREIAAKNLLVVAVGEVAVGLVGNFIGFLGIVSGVVVGYFTWTVLPTPIFVPISAGGVVIIFTIAFVSFVKVAYYTCLYVNAVETARVGRRVIPVGPLAAALET